MARSARLVLVALSLFAAFAQSACSSSSSDVVVGRRGYGYSSVPDGESKYDKKGRLRADGFKLVVVPEEARIVQRIYRDFIDGKAVPASRRT